jgi:hypothetical protein
VISTGSGQEVPRKHTVTPTTHLGITGFVGDGELSGNGESGEGVKGLAETRVMILDTVGR